MKKMLVLIFLCTPIFVKAQTSAVNQVTGNVQVSLIDAQVTTLNVGDEKKMEWRFVSTYQQGTLKIKLIAEDGLQINSSQREFTFYIQPKTEYKIPADVQALANGRKYINFYVHYEADGQKLDGTTSAVFQVGQSTRLNKMQVENGGVTVFKAIEQVKSGQ